MAVTIPAVSIGIVAIRDKLYQLKLVASLKRGIMTSQACFDYIQILTIAASEHDNTCLNIIGNP